MSSYLGEDALLLVDHFDDADDLAADGDRHAQDRPGLVTSLLVHRLSQGDYTCDVCSKLAPTIEYKEVLANLTRRDPVGARQRKEELYPNHLQKFLLS